MDLVGLYEKPELAYHCFLCGKCRELCPKGIDGRVIALANRQKMVKEGGGKLPDNSYEGLLLEKSPYKFANYRHAKKKSVLFTGCNFPSFYPETCDKLVEEFKKFGVGVVYDCCGKPIEELGLVEEAEGIISRINKKLKEAGVEQVIMACPNCYYFPSYEIMLDELRDYRFYAEDLVHPSAIAVEYIWQKFVESYMTDNTQREMQMLHQLWRDRQHRFLHPDSQDAQSFQKKLNQRIQQVQSIYPWII